MKKTFNASRFRRLFFKHTVEHYKRYLMSLFVLIGVMVLGGGFLVYLIAFPLDRNVQTGLFLIILLLAGTIFTSTIFAELGDKKRAIAWLTLPASHFEKYLVLWIYSFVIFAIIYTASFYSVTIFALNLKQFPGHRIEVFNVFDKQVLQMYLIYAFLHGIAFYGAIYFEKLHFIKTAFIFFICLAILILLNKTLVGVMLGREVEASPPFGNARFLERGQITDINITYHQGNYLIWLIVFLTLIFWTAAYYRLKEKRI